MNNDNMALVKYGQGNFQFLRVIQVLESDQASCRKLRQNWEPLAYNIGLSDSEIAELGRRLKAEELGLDDILIAVLTIWRGESHEGFSNLKCLYNALYAERYFDLAEAVRNKFCPNANIRALPWSDPLSPPASKRPRFSLESENDFPILTHDDAADALQALSPVHLLNYSGSVDSGIAMGVVARNSGRSSGGTPLKNDDEDHWKLALQRMKLEHADAPEMLKAIVPYNEVPPYATVVEVKVETPPHIDDNRPETPANGNGVHDDGDSSNASVKKEEYDGEDSDDDDEEEGKVPMLFQAIEKGLSVPLIKDLLDEAGNACVNESSRRKFTAVHYAIKAQMKKASTKEGTLEVLKLLVTKEYGLSLMDAPSADGLTPLMYAMKLRYLDEALLDFFHECGANFNAVDAAGDSVLLIAIAKNQDLGIIRKVLQYNGENLEHKNNEGLNALHVAARGANPTLLEYFLTRLDVNGQDAAGNTALHWLFSMEDPDPEYADCLAALLRKGADWSVKNNYNVPPLLHWILYANQDPYEALVALKKRLPITRKMASAAITLMVSTPPDLDHHLQFSVTYDETEQSRLAPQFTQFFKFLVDRKGGKLLLQNNSISSWRHLEGWRKNRLHKVCVGGGFLEKIGRYTKWKKEPNVISLGKLVLRHPKISFEQVLVAFLECPRLCMYMSMCMIFRGICRQDII